MTYNFNRLLILRCFREDRTLLAVNDFIRKVDFIDQHGGRLPVMGPKYTEPVTDTVESVYKEMESTTPVIFLLSAGTWLLFIHIHYTIFKRNVIIDNTYQVRIPQTPSKHWPEGSEKKSSVLVWERAKMWWPCELLIRPLRWVPGYENEIINTNIWICILLLTTYRFYCKIVTWG